ncbi:hypothetical protein [Vibrio ziniensis]|uniref:Uncharacterized protein n=1 Tax=Vibrio ziniensis TaxID=2711221 RepID=A0A6G7CMZ2_9VIBR|nr:hypothetical protein [Vibrio ziniensis]QIH43472.1 hypothetical protein G5S32_15860 [Vibrio ziniensis]
MKRGEINPEKVPVSEIVNITVPVQLVIRKGEFDVIELRIANQSVPAFRGFANVLLEKQREFERQKKETPHDW